MKKIAAILLFVCLGMLWLSGGAGYCYWLTAGSGAACTLPAGIHPSSQQAFEALTESASIFELPSQVRVPASEHVYRQVRPVPVIPALEVAARQFNDSGCALRRDISSALFPTAARSIDHYIYGLRKIVI